MSHYATKYLTPADADAFLDHTPVAVIPDGNKLCPVCKGNGGWNLEINQYRLPPNTEDTPENRHKFVHFRCLCGHCNGWGYVPLSETCSGHDWRPIPGGAMFEHHYECRHCGKLIITDSSD